MSLRCAAPAVTRLLICVIVMRLGLVPAWADAGSDVRCDLSVTPLNFGEYSPVATRPVDFTATVAVDCRAANEMPTAVDASISFIFNGASSVPSLQSGNQTLRYQMYLDAGRSVLWHANRDISVFSGYVSASMPLRRTLTIYGRLPARQFSSKVGFYDDVITITLTY